jgi:hypothetical protein
MVDTNMTDIWDAYNTLLLSGESDRLRKILTRYNAYKQASALTGDIIEMGIFKGAGLMTWLKFVQFHEPISNRRVVGFDCFDKDIFLNTCRDYEKESASHFLAEAGELDSEQVIAQCYESAEELGMVDRLVIQVGDVGKSIPHYVKANRGRRVALLHLDIDSYYGTQEALEGFYPLLVPGGVVLMDEYGIEGWGASDAVDEYFKGLDKSPELLAVKGVVKPTTICIKPG